MTKDQEDDFERLMGEAMAREEIRRKKRLRARDRLWFWIAVASGLVLAACQAADFGGFWGYLIFAQFLIVFGFYTRFLSFPASYQDEVFFCEWRRPLTLWGEFAHEGRLGELVTVISIPLAGELIGSFLG